MYSHFTYSGCVINIKGCWYFLASNDDHLHLLVLVSILHVWDIFLIQIVVWMGLSWMLRNCANGLWQWTRKLWGHMFMWSGKMSQYVSLENSDPYTMKLESFLIQICFKFTPVTEWSVKSKVYIVQILKLLSLFCKAILTSQLNHDIQWQLHWSLWIPFHSFRGS